MKRIESHIKGFAAFLFSFLFMIIFNGIGLPLFPVLIGLLLWCVFGFFYENMNYEGVNTLINQKKYTKYVKNTIFDHEAINRSGKLRFIRMWFFLIFWPKFMIRQISEK